MSELTNEHIQLIQRAHRWKMAFLGAVILIAGIIIGIGSALIFRPPPKGNIPQDIVYLNERIFRSLQEELELNPDQADQVNVILEKHLNKLNEIRQQARPKMAEIMNSLYAEVLTVLDEPQKEQWKKSIDRLSNKFTRPGPGRGRRGGGQMGPGGFDGHGPMRGPGTGRPPSHRPFDSWTPSQKPDGANDSSPRRRNTRPHPQRSDKSSTDPANDAPTPDERK